MDQAIAMPPRRRWPHLSRVRRRIIWATTLLVLTMNAFAYIQAWRMTHFITMDTRTPPPEKLTTTAKLRVLFTGVKIPRPANTTTPADYNIPFEVRHITAPPIDLEAWSIPAPANSSPRPLILMFHAYAASKSSLLPAAQTLHQLDYPLLMVDFRGSGGSTGNSTTIGYLEANNVAAAVQYAKENLLLPHQPLVLFGQSMRRAAVLRAVGQLNVSADAIIIESPYDRLLSTVENRFHAMKLPAFPLARLLIFWGSEQQGYWAFDMNPAVFAADVHTPTLMFHGQLDSRITLDQAQSVYDHLAGPKQFELYQNAGHTSFLSSDPQRWTKSINDFLTTYAP